jgi:hypothetical protein
MKSIFWKTIIRVLGLGAATWALCDIIRQHHLFGF